MSGDDMLNARVVEENDGFTVIVGPTVAHARDLDGAITEAIIELRAYAADFADHLHAVPNHQPWQELVAHVNHQSDTQLRAKLKRARS